MDFPGVWQHFAIPADALTEETFEEGIGFDGSSVRRLAGDQRGRPAGRPAARDGADRPVHGAADADDDLQHPGPDHPAGLHPRPPQHRPQGRQPTCGAPAIADDCRIAPELEFFVFDDVRFDQTANEAFYHVDSVEGAWNRGRSERPQPRLQAGLGPGLLPLPADRQPGRPADRDGPDHGRVRHRAPPRTFTRSPPAASARST